MWKRNIKGSDCVRIPRCKKATVYLVLQCILLLEVIVLLSVEYKTKSDQYENSEEYFANKKKELLDEIKKFSKTKVELDDITKEMVQENEKLTETKVRLRKMDKWMCYQSGLYYTSSETKNWEDSRKDCEGRNTHLMIINSKEELDFFKYDPEVWIGLNNTDVGNTWKWVDGTAMNSGFGAAGQPNKGRGNCAASHSSELYAKPCGSFFKWICERKRS